jgi:hypothetical protein
MPFPLSSCLHNPDDIIIHIVNLHILPHSCLQVLQDHHPSQIIHQAGDMTILKTTDRINLSNLF